ncbi:hypothetical protein PUN28_018206 [Cardiocondyla obscurior]|uniref:LAGLIDADG homing endonuclease n=1 Tax=Cardiocondyla obscurior TaxID=286306 RepID=A0AAW2EKH6_9HYME
MRIADNSYANMTDSLRGTRHTKHPRLIAIFCGDGCGINRWKFAGKIYIETLHVNRAIINYFRKATKLFIKSYLPRSAWLSRDSNDAFRF